MFNSILIATDFSPAAWKAMKVGRKLNDSYDSSLTMLHIFPADKRPKIVPKVQDQKMKEINNHMKKICEEMMPDNTMVSSAVLPGRVRVELMEFINRNRFDLVIMGINGDGGSANTGSNTKYMLEQSATPVLVIPNNYQFDE